MWAIDADGTNLRQITRGESEQSPSVSDDGRVLVYTTIRSTALWAIALPDGQPRKITDRVNGRGHLSPDGKLVLYRAWTPRENRMANNLRIDPVAGGEPLMDLAWSGGGLLRWGPDGKSSAYRGSTGSSQNIFLMPIGGGKPVQQTQFTSGFLSDFDWTTDGRLVVTHGTSRSDVVLIRECPAVGGSGQCFSRTGEGRRRERALTFHPGETSLRMLARIYHHAVPELLWELKGQSSLSGSGGVRLC